MQRLISSLILIACSLASAQLPVIPLYQNPSSTPLPVPKQIAGLAEWWVHTDITNNTTVTNWIGRIQGTISTNGNTAWQPTNSSKGVWFGVDAVSLTNNPITIGNNWTVIEFMQKTANGYEATIESSWGDNTMAGINFGYFNGAGSTVQPGGMVDSINIGPSGHNIKLNVEYDVTIVSSNNSGVTKLFFYTNAVFTGTAAPANTSRSFACMGESKTWSPNNSAQMYKREMLIYTNAILTPAQILLIDQYRTNTYGSP